MSSNKNYRCVNCGEPCSALYKNYGPTVLKLTKCISCKGIVDKYIEYDPVIVMIDLVLMSKEAQRHILYNTEFKAYWKLFIILMMLETYAVWRSDCLFSLAVDMLCNAQTNYTVNATSIHVPLSASLRALSRAPCAGWRRSREQHADIFIWEKDFYVQFISTFSGIVVFICTVHFVMNVMQLCAARRRVSWELLVKAFSLGNMALVMSLPALVWRGAAAAGHSHHALVFLYTLVVFYNVFTVVYERAGPGGAARAGALVAGHCAKYLTTFLATPLLRALAPTQ